jgi:hypothetical protein
MNHNSAVSYFPRIKICTTNVWKTRHAGLTLSNDLVG